MSRKNKSSQRRIEANRRNALKSTGPRTVEGKAASSQNALTHGLTANPLPKGCFLVTEDEPQFRVLLGEYLATYNPQHRDEYDLLTEAVYAKWRQQRMWLAETAQIELAIARNEPTLQKELPRADGPAHLANGIAYCENMLRLYLRYGSQLHRQYLRCLKELRDLQAERLPTDPPNEPIEPANTDRKGADPKPVEPIEPNKAIEPIQTAGAAVPNEANAVPQTDAQLFEEYRDRLLQRAAEKLAVQNRTSENKPGDLVAKN